MTRVVIVGFALCVIVVVVVVTLWWAHDNSLRDHAERLAVIEAALRIGERDDDTAPMPAVHVAGARTAVAAAREANRERPTPFPRGRHRAPDLSQRAGT